MRLLNRLQHFFEKLTYVIKIFSLHWFNIFLVVVLAVCFWSLSQGVDVLTKTAELKHWYSKDIVLLALYFYAFVIWYSSRAVSWQHTDLVLSNVTKIVIKHLPRLMGYYVYVIFYISYLNSPLITNGINSLEFYLLLILFLSFYILLVK